MRIFLHPGYVTSKNDFQEHFISARRLAELYKVDFSECKVIPHNSPEKGRGIIYIEGDIHLYPDYSGEYKLNRGKDK